MAFAPATGLAGAGARFAELREAVYGLEHQLRNLSLAPSPAAVSGEPAARAESPSTTSTLFNYVGFERRFRGDPDVIVATLQERYGDLLADHQPVVDIGCGRAELLAALAERGVSVIGVEPDPAMVAEGRSRGVTVHQALADEWLSDQPDGSLGSVITTHVVEHLELDDLIRMIELSVRKLRPGGVFIAETPNPASLIVLGNSYILDPTHVRPLHPSLLAFLCETAGFRDVRLHFYAPAESYHLQPVTAPDSPEWVNQVNDAFANLNEVLFGPQEYAVIATTPTSSAVQTPL
jgi:SAM-dependent methyltransferase